MVIVSDILLPKNEDGILKVSDIHTSEESDLSARTDITDPTTSTFIKTDAVGRLNILESNIEGAGADNSLNATSYPVHQVGGFDGSAYRSLKCSNVGRLEVDINSGGSSGGATETTLSALNDKITKGNSTIASGGSLQSVLLYGRKTDGTLEPLECSGDRLLVDVVELAQAGQITTSTALSSVQICGFNSGDSKFKSLACDADGHLKVDIQDNANVKIEDLSSQLNSGITDDPTNSIAVGMRGRTNIGSASTETFVKVNTLGELVTAHPDKTELDVFTVGERTVTGASVTSTNTLELRGTGKVCITIHADTTSHSAIVRLSNDGSNFFTPTTGSTFNPSGAGNLLVAEFDNIARLVQVEYSNTSGGTVVISQAKLVY
jgi:hypothetical protein